MKELINPALLPMINNGMLSVERINHLIYVKEFVDRIAGKNYVSEQTVAGLKKLYGVEPNIITWGDYFQTELASALPDVSDREFERAVDTVRFDMISSYRIFSNKEWSFFLWVEEQYREVMARGEKEYTEDETEILHLHVLMEYYRDMELKDAFTEGEILWYEPFKEAMAV
jgi:hypothetical protein